jgi:hypothetical protein
MNNRGFLKLDPQRYRLKLAVCEFLTLQVFLNFNAGGYCSKLMIRQTTQFAFCEIPYIIHDDLCLSPAL